eukprot:gene20510-7484_t
MTIGRIEGLRDFMEKWQGISIHLPDPSLAPPNGKNKRSEQEWKNYIFGTDERGPTPPHTNCVLQIDGVVANWLIQ